MRQPRFLALAIVVSLATLAGPPSVAHGILLLTVDRTADTTDGSCDAPSDCTLREAIIATNAAGTPDLINFSIPGAGPHDRSGIPSSDGHRRCSDRWHKRA